MSANNSTDNIKIARGSVIQRWRQFHVAYPRISAAMVLGIAVFFLIDLALVYKRVEYGRDLARLRATMTEAEGRRIDAIAVAEGNRLAMAVELARQEALGDVEMHLAVDTGKGTMFLERDGAQLREMPVRIGREATVGTPPDTVRRAPPRGKCSVTRVVDGSYRWEVPEWVYIHHGQPVPADRGLPGALGPLAIFLDSGSVIYSRPATGLLSDANYVLPGSVRTEAADFAAIKSSLQPGMAVYFY